MAEKFVCGFFSEMKYRPTLQFDLKPIMQKFITHIEKIFDAKMYNINSKRAFELSYLLK